MTVSGLSANHLQAMKDVLAISSADLANLQRSAYSGVVENAILVGQTLNSAISASGAAGFFTTPFPGTSLGNQMKMIARLIHGRTALNMKRQIFFAMDSDPSILKGQWNLENMTSKKPMLKSEFLGDVGIETDGGDA